MKYGLKLWSINTDNYYFEAIRLFESKIFDYIELYVVPNSLDKLVSWKLAQKNHKIPFIIHCPHFAHGFNLAKATKKEGNLKIYEEVKQYADELNAKYIIFHGGIDGNIEETAKQLANFKEPRALIENKPYVALPNKMGGNFCRGFNTVEIKTVMDRAKCGLCLDFGHAICAANSLKQDVYEYLEPFMALNPSMFHLTDIEEITSPFDSHPHLGTGQLDLKKISSMLPKDAIITLETVKNSKETLDDFIGDVQCMKNII